MTKAYWQQRMQGEKSFDKWLLETDDRFDKYYQDRFNALLSHFQSEIAREYTSLTNATGMSRDLAKQTVSNLDMKEYSQLAKRVVKEAQEARKGGNPKAFKGYSDEVNLRMKIYNATMRINRLELLKSRLATYLLEVNAELDADLRKTLSDTYVNRVKEQAGLLGQNMTSEDIDLNIQEAISYMYGNATFSQRIWKNQDVIKSSLDKVVSQGSLGGYGLEKMISQLRKLTNANYNNAKRIIRTEMTRVMDKAQEDAFRNADIKLVFWQVEKKPCAACLAIHDNDVGYGKGVYPIDDSPKPVEDTHPNCRCLRSAFTEYEAWQLQWAKSKDKNAYLDQYGRVRYSDGRPVEDYLEAEKVKAKQVEEKPVDYSSLSKGSLLKSVLGKPMSIDKADQTNNNPYYLGKTARTRYKVEQARQMLTQDSEIKRVYENAVALLRKSKGRLSLEYQEYVNKHSEAIKQYNKAIDDYNNWLKRNKKYTANCQRCAVTYELRRRGYNVTAGANPAYDSKLMAKMKRSLEAMKIKSLNPDILVAYNIPKNFFDIPEGVKNGGIRNFEVETNSEVDSTLLNEMKPGQRGTLSWVWKEGDSGHIINVERTNDGLLYVDTQPGKQAKSFAEYMKNRNFSTAYGRSGVNFQRTDNLIVNEDMAKMFIVDGK